MDGNYKRGYSASCRKCKKKSGVCLRRGFEGHLPIGDDGCLRPADPQLGSIVAAKHGTNETNEPGSKHCNIILSTMHSQPVHAKKKSNKRKFLNLQKNTCNNSNTTSSTKPPKQKKKKKSERKVEGEA
jgi:hypothetical protein